MGGGPGKYHKPPLPLRRTVIALKCLYRPVFTTQIQ